MARIAWNFTDPVTSESVDLEVNPSEGGSLKLEKNLSYINTSAPDGRVLAYEGRQKPQESSFSGTVLTEDQYNFWVDWFNKRYQFYMTDDLGRVMTIYITSFEPKRVRSKDYPWKHTITVTYVVIDWD